MMNTEIKSTEKCLKRLRLVRRIPRTVVGSFVPVLLDSKWKTLVASMRKKASTRTLKWMGLFLWWYFEKIIQLFWSFIQSLPGYYFTMIQWHCSIIFRFPNCSDCDHFFWGLGFWRVILVCHKTIGIRCTKLQCTQLYWHHSGPWLVWAWSRMQAGWARWDCQEGHGLIPNPVVAYFFWQENDQPTHFGAPCFQWHPHLVSGGESCVCVWPRTWSCTGKDEDEYGYQGVNWQARSHRGLDLDQIGWALDKLISAW